MLLRSAPFSIVLLAASLLCGPVAHALDPNKAFHHYVQDTWSIEDGLPQITVRAITQDREGYLWFGTQLGVARFDGVRFTAFNTSNAPQLPGQYINALLSESDGRIWIGTYKGLAVYENGQFQAIPSDADSSGLDILSLVHSNAGEVLAGTRQGVYAVHADRLLRRHALPGPAQALLVDKDSNALWVGSTGGTYRMEDAQQDFLALPEDAAEAMVTQLASAHGRLWAGTSTGLFVLTDGAWQRYTSDSNDGLSHSPIEEIFLDSDGNLWVAMIDHLIRIREGVVHERIHRKPTALAIRSAFEDREGNLWLGGQWDGVTRLWNGWTRRYSTWEGLDDPIVWSIAAAPDGVKWVGTETGLSRFANGTFERIVPGHLLPHPNAYTLLAEAGKVWIGTRRGVAVLTEDEGLVRPKILDPLNSAQINGIVRDSQGTLWFTTTQGLYRLIDDLLVRFAESEGLSDPRTRIFYETKSGRRLIGGQGGLFEFSDERLLPVGLDHGLSNKLDVTSIHELRDGRLVIGTFSEGLYLFEAGRWHHLNQAGGLLNQTPFFITDDGADYLWVTGIRGIYRIALDSITAKESEPMIAISGEMLLNERGDRRGGQKGFCCNGAGNAKGMMENGVLWLPSRDGIVALSTTEVVKNPIAPAVRVESVLVNGQWREADPKANWNLPQSARDLSFEFTVLSFQDPGSVDIRYRLHGYDRDWRTLDTPHRRQAFYTNLPPGNYVFEVSGSNNFGVWSPQPASLAVHIAPRFHETTLFLVMLGLLLASLLYGGYRQLLLSHQRQRSALELLVKQRTEALEVSNRQLEDASQVDILTGLRNRRFISNQLPADLAYYERERSSRDRGPEGLVFAMLEIDQLKAMKQHYGQEAANHLVRQVAGQLGRWLRNGDYIARWSENEFLLVFRPLPSQGLPLLGQRLCRTIRQQAFEPTPNKPEAISCSIGLIECPVSNEGRGRSGWEQFVDLAERTKNLTSRYGGNGWAVVQPKYGHDADTLRKIANDGIEQAVESGRIELICADNLRAMHAAVATR